MNKSYRSAVKSYVKTLILNTSAFSLVLLLSIAVFGQRNNAINGFVFGAERQPISEIQVELFDENNRFLERVRTDGGGRYNFTRLGLGRFYLRVSAIGTNYEEQTKEVEIFSNRAGAGVGGSSTIQQDFYLRPSRNANSPLANNAVIFAQDTPPEAKQLYDKALTDLKDKKNEAAITKLLAAIQIFPNYYLALEKLGETYVNQQKYTDARDVLIKAVDINPRDFHGRYSLAYSLYQLKKYPEAFESVKKSLEINSQSVNGLFLQGVILKQLGKYEEAVQNLKKAEKLSTTPVSEIYWQLSLIYTNNLKDYAAAAKELEKFLQAKPDYEEAEKVSELIKKLKAKSK